MKDAERFLLHTCAYTVLICALFLLFMAISGFTEASLNIGRFFLILLFSFFISVAGIILGLKRLHLVLRIAIHFLVLLVAFTVVFVISGNIKASGAGAIFSAIIVFSFLYSVVSLIVYSIKKSVSAVDKKLEKRSVKSDSKKPAPYTPRYKNDN